MMGVASIFIASPTEMMLELDATNATTGSDGEIDLTVSGGTPPYTFEWSNGADTEDLLDAEAGTVTVTVTDAGGAMFVSDDIIVPGTPVLTVTAIITNESEPGAADGMIEITDVVGGAGPYNYIWNNGATTGTIDGLIDAFWCVQISDANGCTTDTCLEVFEGDPLSLIEANDILMMNVFPNPAINGEVNIQLEMAQPIDVQMELIDAMGRIIYAERFADRLQINEQIDLSAEASGIYTLRIFEESNGTMRTMLISR